MIRSQRSFLTSPTRPLQRPAHRPNAAETLVRSLLQHLSGLLRHLRPGLAHCTPDHAPPARKAARAAATITSTAEVSADAAAFDYRVPMVSAVNLSSLGQPEGVSASTSICPGLALAPAQLLADEFVSQDSPSLSDLACQPLPTSFSRLTLMMPHRTMPLRPRRLRMRRPQSRRPPEHLCAPVLTQFVLRLQIPDCSTIPGVVGGAGVCPTAPPATRRVAPSHVQGADPAFRTSASV